ncbi:MAG: FkbM family methyltransferase, partial [Spirochaetia bacterium]|nr:FkbM family methyltransferase [Spirochaetia bacterium]
PQPSCRKLLINWFGEHNKVSLDFSSLGNEEKKTQLFVSSKYPTLASVDSDWVIENQGRAAFKKVKWDIIEEIRMTTLDDAIKKYGKPVFIKIDTEGSEDKVLSGLSTAVECVSFEFLPWQRQQALKCIDKIVRLGNYSFNFSRGESMKLFFSSWLSAKEIRNFIRNYGEDTQSGDIYAKLDK